MDLALAILCSGVAAFLIGNTVLAWMRGSVRHGHAILLRAEEPALFWIVVVSGLAAACACAMAVWVFTTTGSFPRTPLIMLAFLVSLGAVWFRDLRRGIVTIGTVAFARTEEPREFWLLLGLKVCFLLFASSPFVLEAFI